MRHKNSGQNIFKYFIGILIVLMLVFSSYLVVAINVSKTSTDDLMISPLSGEPPYTPYNPSPSHREYNVNYTSANLSWESGDPDGDIVSYDIYFGKPDDLTRIEMFYPHKYYEIGPLNDNDNYQWQIVAFDGTTHMWGPLWDFTTGGNNFSMTVVNKTVNPGDKGVVVEIYGTWGFLLSGLTIGSVSYTHLRAHET